MFPPERIVCLTEETVETLYLLGEEHRVVGVSGYAVRPPRVRKEKPRVSAFISADYDKVLALAARELARPAVEQMPDVEQVNDALEIGGIAREAAHAPAVIEVRRDGKVREQPPFLEHIADVPPMRRHIDAG